MIICVPQFGPVLEPRGACKHRTQELSYTAFIDDSDRRMAAGDDQTMCPYCRRYVWNSMYVEMPPDPFAGSTPGPEPAEEPYHFAAKIRADGRVIALCAKRPVMLARSKKYTWTPSGVTCKRCRKLLDERRPHQEPTK